PDSIVASDQLKLIDAGGPLVRAALVVVVLAALLCSWRALRWYAGSEIALAAPQLPENALDAAQTAARLSPDDPLARRALASVLQRGVGAGDLQAAISEYKRAVSLSPGDFRLWTDLGRAEEQAGNMAESEKALRRAVELAPHYSWPRWHLGNFLLRRGRYDEALAELRRVAEEDQSKRGAIFDYAWMIYDGDVAAVSRALGGSPAVRAEFIIYLIGRKRMTEALEIWSSFSREQKKEFEPTGKLLVDSLVAEKRFRMALESLRDLSDDKSAFEVGKVSNGSFEGAVAQDGSGLFAWNVPSSPQARASLDPGKAQQGSLSLRINFNASEALDLNVSQLVAVEPNAGYRLTFYVRTSGLKSAAAPVVKILSAVDKSLIAEPAQSPTGDNDWQKISIDFKAPADVDGITLSISRAACVAEGGVCPIFGTVWYDDFNLQLAGREAGARPTGAGK
ncbi:MAG TPA: tetratricopeptide repeat protein, partial [Pyrinomonadaceae bacterium]|nr:tetratricopeptide repeat protein [Pyrinomonadaceae bacterium]